MTPIPAKYFAHPPYRAELFSARSGWAGVMNRNGINCLTFLDGLPDQTITNMNHALRIAEKWNDKIEVYLQDE